MSDEYGVQPDGSIKPPPEFRETLDKCAATAHVVTRLMRTLVDIAADASKAEALAWEGISIKYGVDVQADTPYIFSRLTGLITKKEAR